MSKGENVCLVNNICAFSSFCDAPDLFGPDVSATAGTGRVVDGGGGEVGSAAGREVLPYIRTD